MTILQLIEHLRMQKLDVPFNSVLGSQRYFAMHETDVFASESRSLFVAINRVSRRYAAQCGELSVMGFAGDEIDSELLDCLLNSR